MGLRLSDFFKALLVREVLTAMPLVNQAMLGPEVIRVFLVSAKNL